MRSALIVCLVVTLLLVGVLASLTSASSEGVQVSDCTVTVAQGASAPALINVSWNFHDNVTLTQMTFEGAGADWLRAPDLPVTLNVSAPVQLRVAVPSGVYDGSYLAEIVSQFSFSNSVETVTSKINIVVDPLDSSWGRGSLLAAEAWFNDHFAVVAGTALFLTGVMIVALVASKRHRWR